MKAFEGKGGYWMGMLLAAGVAGLVACDRQSQQGEEEVVAGEATEQAEEHPADAFLAAFRPHCGLAYAGRVIANDPPQEEDPFADHELVMHVRECGETEIRIPFHVGEDRSRTWILTRTEGGLRLKHDHRHEDGSDDETTMYGGDTSEPGSALRQEFPVDAESVALFERVGLNASLTNVWAMEILPGEWFRYELTRPGGREFRVEFDLREPVEAPPSPWGHPEL